MTEQCAGRVWEIALVRGDCRRPALHCGYCPHCWIKLSVRKQRVLRKAYGLPDPEPMRMEPDTAIISQIGRAAVKGILSGAWVVAGGIVFVHGRAKGWW